MDPIGRPLRRTPMRRSALPVAALLVPLALAGCGSDDDSGEDIAADPAPTPATATPTPTPTAPPSPGTYPEFGPTDYTYVLEVSCFCADAGVPIAITVEDDEVVDSSYAEGSEGGPAAGDPVRGGAFLLTIDEVIAKANDTTAAKVTVDWPAGQDYPNSVFVDHRKQVADDEVGYTLSDVQVP